MNKFLVLFVLILTVVSATGCISKSIDQEKRPVVQLMKMIPSGCDGYTFADMNVMLTDPVLSTMVGNDFDDLEELFKAIGLDIDEVNYWISAEGCEEGEVLIVQASFDFINDMRTLTYFGYGKPHKYKGIEIWKVSDESIILLPPYMIFCDTTIVEACIDVTITRADSLYDDMTYKNIISKLPDGPVVSCGNTTFWQYMESNSNLESMGTVLQHKGANIIELVNVAKFEDEDIASVKMTEFSNNEIENADFETVITSLMTEGQYGYVTFEIDTEHPLEPSYIRNEDTSTLEPTSTPTPEILTPVPKPIHTSAPTPEKLISEDTVEAFVEVCFTSGDVETSKSYLTQRLQNDVDYMVDFENSVKTLASMVVMVTNLKTKLISQTEDEVVIQADFDLEIDLLGNSQRKTSSNEHMVMTYTLVEENGLWLIDVLFVGTAFQFERQLQEALDTEKENVQLAMVALMADNGVYTVTPQTTWTNDLSGDIITGDYPSLSYYLDKAESMKGYYQWDSDYVYQCIDTSCPDPF